MIALAHTHAHRAHMPALGGRDARRMLRRGRRSRGRCGWGGEPSPPLLLEMLGGEKHEYARYATRLSFVDAIASNFSVERGKNVKTLPRGPGGRCRPGAIPSVTRAPSPFAFHRRSQLLFSRNNLAARRQITETTCPRHTYTPPAVNSSEKSIFLCSHAGDAVLRLGNEGEEAVCSHGAEPLSGSSVVRSRAGDPSARVCRRKMKRRRGRR